MPDPIDEKVMEIGNLDSTHISGEGVNSFKNVCHRARDDPMLLHREVIEIIQNYFLNRALTQLLPAQRHALAAIAEGVLSAVPDTVTAVPLVPGGGKSTLIRALLSAISPLVAAMDSPLAQKLGGVIVVVEKSIEAHELEELCNNVAGCRVATVIESPNDYNLRNGCLNGMATRFEECPRRACPDYGTCPLIRAASKTEETPVLILLHARYQRYLEDMSPFLSWTAGEQKYPRTLLLVDELPSMFEDNALCLATLNDAETEIDQLKPSYRPEQRAAKHEILHQWNKCVRTPFFKTSRLPQCQHTNCCLITEEMKAAAGIMEDDLAYLQTCLTQYADHSKAEGIVNALLSGGNVYQSTDRSFTIFSPRLKKVDVKSHLATFIFSGTASLSPELAGNPEVHLFTDELPCESYARLKIVAQRGDGFSASKIALESGKNREGVLQWLRCILPPLAERHRKILAVTYQTIAEWLWQQLSDYQSSLIPYIDSENQPTSKLPYFGGLTGSNLYQEATCVICIGLSRFEPREYLNRALALDFSGEAAKEMRTAAEAGKAVCYDQIPGVKAMENITLARDLVQLVFRSALRRHGEQTPIELWLLHPPDAVLEHLKQYFGDCHIETIPELPESCRHLATTSRRYKSEKTHAAVLLHWLETCQQQEFTPEEARKQTGLTPGQFKEAKKNPEVRRYFQNHIDAAGSGRNTVYRFMENRSPPPDAA